MPDGERERRVYGTVWERLVALCLWAYPFALNLYLAWNRNAKSGEWGWQGLRLQCPHRSHLHTSRTSLAFILRSHSQAANGHGQLSAGSSAGSGFTLAKLNPHFPRPTCPISLAVTRKQRMDLVNAAQQGLAEQGLMYRVQPGENRTRLFEGRDIATGQVCWAKEGKAQEGRRWGSKGCVGTDGVYGVRPAPRGSKGWVGGWRLWPHGGKSRPPKKTKKKREKRGIIAGKVCEGVGSKEAPPGKERRQMTSLPASLYSCSGFVCSFATFLTP